MDSLPAELLQVVFEAFVHISRGNPRALGLVSHRWRSIVYATPSLWSHIALLGKTNLRLPIGAPDPSYTRCRAAKELESILIRAGSTKLDVWISVESMEILSDKWTTIDSNWLSKRCRKLTIYGASWSGNPWIRHLAEVEELVVSRPPLQSAELWEDLQEHSIKLSSLELSGADVHLLAQFPKLSRRLRNVRVMDSEELRTVNSENLRLDSVECLLWSGAHPGNPVPPTTTHLRTLKLYRYREVVVPKAIWNSLTELWLLRPVRGSVRLVQGSLALLALKTLILEGDWVELSCIYAPALKTLRMMRWWATAGECRSALLSCTLRPPVVYIEVCVTAATLFLLLQGVWSGIEELHCIYNFTDDLDPFPEKLADHLCQSWLTHAKAPICPQLTTFTMLLDYTLRPAAVGDAVQVKAVVRKMVERRKAFAPLAIVLLGIRKSGIYGVSTEWASFS
ncbi:hypothetical protein PIIN_09833 [Serendipita indica DSM 11827]|uniref:F-box domain-containing protein n=1 Tax=Serendipita indica (strain DSM 11827) TaxID=1109443 RepID=G4TX02_SERID|nr:hypothetical protein PIIN_09833 [Serendipita indica DSM 11827]